MIAIIDRLYAQTGLRHKGDPDDGDDELSEESDRRAFLERQVERRRRWRQELEEADRRRQRQLAALRQRKRDEALVELNQLRRRFVAYADTWPDPPDPQWLAMAVDFEYPNNQEGTTYRSKAAQFPVRPLAATLVWRDADPTDPLDLPSLSIDFEFIRGQEHDFTPAELVAFDYEDYVSEAEATRAEALLRASDTATQRAAVRAVERRQFRQERWPVIVQRPGRLAVPFSESLASDPAVVFSDGANSVLSGDRVRFKAAFVDTDFTRKSYTDDSFDEEAAIAGKGIVLLPMLEPPVPRPESFATAAHTVFVMHVGELADNPDSDAEPTF